MSTAALLLVVGLAVFNLLAGAYHLLRLRCAKAWQAKAEAEWADAVRFVEVANLQAQVLAECRELLCDDCCVIVHGHYMSKAYGAADALINSDEARED